MLDKLLIILFLILSFAIAEEKISDDKTQLEKEMETVNFDSLKDVLKEDMLVPVVEGKKDVVKKIVEKRLVDDTVKFNYPTEDDIWRVVTPLWLVKNASTLKWDISKPSYGIESNFKKLLESIGYLEKKINILLIKNPEVTHFALPLAYNEFLFIISIPFIRSMDLSKVEISLLMLEDLIRLEKNYLKTNLKLETKWLGTNFKSEGYKKEYIEDILKRITANIFEKGFSFQQQFETTKQMDLLLKSELNLWNGYLKLLKKIDDLVKGNDIYKNYLKIYPSPEMQIKWISPENK